MGKQMSIQHWKIGENSEVRLQGGDVSLNSKNKIPNFIANHYIHSSSHNFNKFKI